MSREFTLPDLGEGIQEGQVLRLLVAEGDHVVEDQLIMEVETDKAAVEIPSPFTGVVARWHVNEQQVVNVGELMVSFSPEGEDTSTAHAASVARAASTAASTATPTIEVTPRPTKPSTRRKPASPAVRKLARAKGIDIELVTGSGPGGRVLRGDVESFAANGVGAHAAVSTPAAPPTRPASAPAPALANVSAPRPTPTGALPDGRDDTDAYGAVRRASLSQTRQAIAGVMTRAWTTIPHVTDSDDADVTELDRLRRGYNETATPERRLGLLPFVIRAVVRALHAHPIFNASLDEATQEIVYKRYYNIAIGVQTDRGLVAPVLRDVDTLSIPEIHERLGQLIQRAKDGTFALDDTRGATYTISNAGAMGGSRYSTPIITPPQVAVLAIGRSRRQPWMVTDTHAGEQIQPRLIMPLSHSMDHRIIDGAQEIAFMQQVIGDVQHPGRLML